MGSIEYLRTKASVDKFINKFGGNVKLQLNNDFQPILSNFQASSKQNAKFGNSL
jgi:predicted SpoU family rRNA methylase